MCNFNKNEQIMLSRLLSKNKILHSFLLWSIGTFFLQAACAQGKISSSQAHSHNDYDRPGAFYAAYQAEFGSLEADIHLKEGVLYVAHDDVGIAKERTLEALYLQPLEKQLKKYKGGVYKDKQKSLQLLVDIKTEAISTLDALVALLSNYPLIMSSKKIKLVISGNRPSPSAYVTYPPYIWFDGRPSEQYDDTASKKLGLISDNYFKYARWNGTGVIPEKEKLALKAAIDKAHGMGKPFRFWATPDTEASWKLFMELGVDYINTDRVPELADFIKKQFP
jgi:alkaline phosphatase